MVGPQPPPGGLPPLLTAFAGLDALDRRQELSAFVLLSAAVASGAGDGVGWGNYGLGLQHRRAGEFAEARACYQRGIDSAHPDAAPWSAWGLGGMLQDQGDLIGARVYLSRAVESGEAVAAPRAACDLARLEEWEGDLDAARRYYRLAAGSTDDEAIPTARRALARLDRGEVLAAPRRVAPGARPLGPPDAPRRQVGDAVLAVVALLACAGIGALLAYGLAALAALGFWPAALATLIGTTVYAVLYGIARGAGPSDSRAWLSTAVYCGALVTTVLLLTVARAHWPVWLAVLAAFVLAGLAAAAGLRRVPENGGVDPGEWSWLGTKH